MTYKPIEGKTNYEDYKDLQVNHINGNKLNLYKYVIIYLTYLHQSAILLLNLPRRISMEDKVPENLLNLFESLLSAQLQTVRRLKNPKSAKGKPKKIGCMSNMDMAVDILRRSRGPLHISEIIAQVKTKYGVTLDRESLVSALVKKVHRRQGLSRTAPNTFQVEPEDK
jgi:hypothetical protein